MSNVTYKNSPNNFFENILDETPIAIANFTMIFDDLNIPCDCLLVGMNHTFAEQFSLDKKTSCGKKASELRSPADMSVFKWSECYENILSVAEKGSECQIYSKFFNKLVNIKILKIGNYDFVIYLMPQQKTKPDKSMPPAADRPVPDSRILKIQKIPAWRGNEDVMLNPRDVYYLSINNGEIMIYTKNDVYFLRGTLKEWELKLQPYHFFRSHKCFLVNLCKISRMTLCVDNSYKICLEGINDEIPLSRNKIQALKDLVFI